MKVKTPAPWRWISLAVLTGVMGALLHWGVLAFLAPGPAPVVLPLEVVQTATTSGAEKSTRLDLSYQFEKQGLKACWLQGPAAVRGAALASFYGQDIVQMVELTGHLEPSAHPWGVKHYVKARWRLWTNRRWLSSFPSEVVQEMSGFSLVEASTTWTRRRLFNRLLGAQLMWERLKSNQHFSWLRGSAFGVASTRRSQPVWMARNFDFEKAAPMETHKLVMLNHPDQGYAYLSVTWPGQVGVVTGMNEKGLGIALLAASTRSSSGQGMPATLLARLVMTQAGSLQEAVAIIKAHSIRRATSFFLGSGTENRFVVVEKDPKQTVLRGMHYNILVATNHFLSPGFEVLSPKPRHYLSSRARYRRLLELVLRYKSHMNVQRAANILRDRAGVHELPLGTGHAFAINNFKTIHSVIFDLSSLTAWVATSPYHLGPYVPFSMKAFVPGQEQPAVAADPAMKADRYKTFLLYQLGFKEAKRLLQKGQAQEALAWIQEMQPLNERDYKLYLLAARALKKLHRRDEALYNLYQAQRLHPATLQDKQAVEKMITALESQSF